MYFYTKPNELKQLILRATFKKKENLNTFMNIHDDGAKQKSDPYQ